jgi:hypothetical protein
MIWSTMSAVTSGTTSSSVPVSARYLYIRREYEQSTSSGSSTSRVQCERTTIRNRSFDALTTVTGRTQRQIVLCPGRDALAPRERNPVMPVELAASGSLQLMQGKASPASNDVRRFSRRRSGSHHSASFRKYPPAEAYDPSGFRARRKVCTLWRQIRNSRFVSASGGPSAITSRPTARSARSARQRTPARSAGWTFATWRSTFSKWRRQC